MKLRTKFPRWPGRCKVKVFKITPARFRVSGFEKSFFNPNLHSLRLGDPPAGKSRVSISSLAHSSLPNVTYSRLPLSICFTISLLSFSRRSAVNRESGWSFLPLPTITPLTPLKLLGNTLISTPWCVPQSRPSTSPETEFRGVDGSPRTCMR